MSVLTKHGAADASAGRLLVGLFARAPVAPNDAPSTIPAQTYPGIGHGISALIILPISL